jgi:hypothetical protein
MGDFFAGLSGHIAQPDVVMNHGPLPSAQDASAVPDGRINNTDALLNGVEPYAYGGPAKQGTQMGALNIPHSIPRIIPVLYLPEVSGRGNFASPHQIADGDIAFTIRLGNDNTVTQLLDRRRDAKYGRLARADPLVNIHTVNYLLSGFQAVIAKAHDEYVVNQTFFQLNLQNSWHNLAEAMDLKLYDYFNAAIVQGGEGLTPTLKKMTMIIVRDMIRPLGVAKGDKKQGGQHQGVNMRSVTYPAELITTLIVDGRLEVLTNIWRHLDISAGDDLVLAIEDVIGGKDKNAEDGGLDTGAEMVMIDPITNKYVRKVDNGSYVEMDQEKASKEYAYLKDTSDDRSKKSAYNDPKPSKSGTVPPTPAKPSKSGTVPPTRPKPVPPVAYGFSSHAQSNIQRIVDFDNRTCNYQLVPKINQREGMLHWHIARSDTMSRAYNDRKTYIPDAARYELGRSLSGTFVPVFYSQKKQILQTSDELDDKVVEDVLEWEMKRMLLEKYSELDTIDRSAKVLSQLVIEGIAHKLYPEESTGSDPISPNGTVFDKQRLEMISDGVSDILDGKTAEGMKKIQEAMNGTLFWEIMNIWKDALDAHNSSRNKDDPEEWMDWANMEFQKIVREAYPGPDPASEKMRQVAENTGKQVKVEVTNSTDQLAAQKKAYKDMKAAQKMAPDDAGRVDEKLASRAHTPADATEENRPLSLMHTEGKSIVMTNVKGTAMMKAGTSANLVVATRQMVQEGIEGVLQLLVRGGFTFDSRSLWIHPVMRGIIGTREEAYARGTTPSMTMAWVKQLTMQGMNAIKHTSRRMLSSALYSQYQLHPYYRPVPVMQIKDMESEDEAETDTDRETEVLKAFIISRSGDQKRDQSSLDQLTVKAKAIFTSMYARLKQARKVRFKRALGPRTNGGKTQREPREDTEGAKGGDTAMDELSSTNDNKTPPRKPAGAKEPVAAARPTRSSLTAEGIAGSSPATVNPPGSVPKAAVGVTKPNSPTPSLLGDATEAKPAEKVPANGPAVGETSILGDDKGTKPAVKVPPTTRLLYDVNKDYNVNKDRLP